MANIPPATGPSDNVTAAFSLHPYSTAQPAFRPDHPVATDQRARDPEASMLQTQTLPPLHHAFPALPRVGLGASHLQLPPLDTRLAMPPGADSQHAAGEGAPATKRRRMEAEAGRRSQSGVHSFADSSARGSTADAGGPAVRVVSSERNVVDDDYHHPHPPRLTTAAAARCCSIGCTGQHCLDQRKLVADLITEITERDISLPDTSAADLREHASPLPHLHKISLVEALEWAVHRLRWNNSAIKQLLISQTPGQLTTSVPTSASVDPFQPQLSSVGPMKRHHEILHPDHEAPSRSSQPLQSLARQPWGPAQDLWTNDQAAHSSQQGSQRKFSTSSTPGVMAMQSPPHNAISSAARMLPSPSSMTLPNPASLGSPALSGTPSSAAQAAHLQDLQHQVSVKSLSLSTLQREYESLLQKLERQRTKSAALEKKFEVSDAELNGLVEDKERLEKQVEMLEKQLEEAQASRDEARKQSTEQASQYMRILDMGNILQRKAVEDRKTWEKEKESLVDRIKELEASDVGPKGSGHGNAHSISGLGSPRQITAPSSPNISKRLEKSHETALPRLSGPAESSQRAKVASPAGALEQEVERLRRRIEVLEAALAASKREGEIIKEAALRLANLNDPTDDS